MPSFPGSVPALSNPTPTTKLGTATAALKHATQHSNGNDEIEALATKLGISESVAVDTPAANTVLQSLTNNKSKWATLITAMIAANAATQVAVDGVTIPTTTSSYPVDITGLLATITATAGSTGILAILHGTFSNSVANAINSVGIRGNAVDTSAALSRTYQITADYHWTTMVAALYTGLTGSQTFQGRFGANAGTLTCHEAQIIVVEFKR